MSKKNQINRNSNMKYVILIILTTSIILSGCSQQITPSEKIVPNHFQVDYYAQHSSSAGTRMLNITYTVQDEEIIGCEGNYTTAMTDGTNTTTCDLQRLQTGDYNVPLELITQYPFNQLQDEVYDGPSMYRWNII
ncbi:MAG: hypothetical protein ACQESC_04680 [Nanobdellota archaeon]